MRGSTNQAIMFARVRWELGLLSSRSGDAVVASSVSPSLALPSKTEAARQEKHKNTDDGGKNHVVTDFEMVNFFSRKLCAEHLIQVCG